jgi:hypothetical protein
MAETPCASPPPRHSIFPIILFMSTILLTGMTGISLYMQRPPTSQSHGSTLKASLRTEEKKGFHFSKKNH